MNWPKRLSRLCQGAGFSATSGHKTCRFQWVFERLVPPQAFATVDSDAAPQSGTFHTAKRCASV